MASQIDDHLTNQHVIIIPAAWLCHSLLQVDQASQARENFMPPLRCRRSCICVFIYYYDFCCLVTSSTAHSLGHSGLGSRFTEIRTASYEGRALTTDIEFEIVPSLDADVLIGMNWIATWRTVRREAPAKDEKKATDIERLVAQSPKKDMPVAPSNVSKLPLAPVKPAKKSITLWVLWVIWYNSYRRFFTIVFIVNFIGLGFAIAGKWPYAAKYPGALVVGNLNVAVLNLGGIHSGCAISGMAWIVLMVVHQLKAKHMFNDSILAFGVITSVMLFITICAGLPWIRNTHHIVFELNHRFFGWTSLCMTCRLDPNVEKLTTTESSATSGNTLSNNRLSDTRSECPSSLFYLGFAHDTSRSTLNCPLQKLLFSVSSVDCNRVLARISRSAVKEYHDFGTVSEGTHAMYHYLICGVQGDFTRGLVNDPPRKIWNRELKFASISNTSTLYKRGIRICTGTGLGVVLSACIQSPYWYLIWIGSDQEKMFGPTINGLIYKHIGPERLLLWDFKVRGGRPP
ncbi:uncharacterized protein HD556DRAFT_1438848 [Suillus plorans]|uniref:Uncharacterized protein n=1 Tax=Suillus plorans TaxID=116603 RepID=A0A9P7DQW6_9AGAM|nr:uncharacterized protein HD556DRAFT_1438848 [Suillus plorans]KAG1800852.1 hypothetical protein HD556DRAFT_1438848 [Suillus plorans]